MKCDSDLIDHRALALEPFFTEDAQTKITTTHGIYYSKMTPCELLDAACVRYASTMDGRKKAVRKSLKFTRKTPFIITEFEVGVFPTISDTSLDCVWIFSHWFQLTKIEKKKTLIEFEKGVSIIVAVSVHTLRQQQQRLHTMLGYYRSIHREQNLYKAGHLKESNPGFYLNRKTVAP